MDADTARIDYTPGDRMRGYDGETIAEARAAFVALFGQEPERVVQAGCIVLAGPEPR